MPESSKPFDPLRKAHEEEYFRKANAKLIAKLREQQAVEQLRSESGVTDEVLLAELARLGITKELLPLVHLVPLIQVAWADGEIQPKERELLVKAAGEAGITEDSPAYDEFSKLLAAPPATQFFEAALSFIRAMFMAMPAEDAESARDNLIDLSVKIADASGGWLGWIQRIDTHERHALREIADRLANLNPEAAVEVVEKV